MEARAGIPRLPGGSAAAGTPRLPGGSAAAGTPRMPGQGRREKQINARTVPLPYVDMYELDPNEYSNTLAWAVADVTAMRQLSRYTDVYSFDNDIARGLNEGRRLYNDLMAGRFGDPMYISTDVLNAFIEYQYYSHLYNDLVIVREREFFKNYTQEEKVEYTQLLKAYMFEAEERLKDYGDQSLVIRLLYDPLLLS
jgi:hypothetical protein